VAAGRAVTDGAGTELVTAGDGLADAVEDAGGVAGGSTAVAGDGTPVMASRAAATRMAPARRHRWLVGGYRVRFMFRSGAMARCGSRATRSRARGATRRAGRAERMSDLTRSP